MPSGGSAARDHRQQQNQTFKTPLVRTEFDFPKDDLGNPAQLFYQVQYKYKDSGAKSTKATLSFYLETGASTVFLNDRALSIFVSGTTYHWDKQRWHDIRNSVPVNGKVISVRLKQSVLRQIAESKKVSGNLTGVPFNWSYKNRKPLRMFLDKLEKESVIGP